MKQELILTIGVPGSGKSTWARQYVKDNPDVIYLSTDKLRAELGFGESDQSVNGLIYIKLKQKTEAALCSGKSVVLDATFIKKAWRKDNIALGRKFGVKLMAHVFKANRETLIDRIKQRVANGGLNVPTEVIDKYIGQYQPPDKTEFDEIINH